MKKRITLSLLGLFSFLTIGFALESADRSATHDAVQSINAADLRASLYFLASDSFQGRNTNSNSNRIAAQFLAYRMKRLGLQGVGRHSEYLHEFTLVQGELGEENGLEIHTSNSPLSKAAVVLEDFVPSSLTANGKVTAPLAFAGFGITAAEYDYDDYAGLEVEGKAVLLLDGEPGETDETSPFDGLVSSPHSDELAKILNAQNHGAVAVILFPPARLSQFSRAGRYLWPEDSSRARYNLQSAVEKISIPVVYASPEVIASLFQGGAADFKRLKEEIGKDYQPRSHLLSGVEVTLKTQVRHRETKVPNVLGYLPGSDPQLKDEVVIVSAHFDHVGTRGEQIFNGADDDGSGTVAVLEIAEAFAQNREKPRRSMLFAFWNAEEKGLLGSTAYVENPSFPLEKTAALFQLDMVGRNQEITDPKNPRFFGMPKQTSAENENMVHLVGYSRNKDLSDLVEDVNSETGLTLTRELDNHRLNILRRSDNWPFLVKGVPSLFFTTGLHPDYHQPGDTPDKINYSKLERISRLVYLAAWETANRLERPGLQFRSGE